MRKAFAFLACTQNEHRHSAKIQKLCSHFSMKIALKIIKRTISVRQPPTEHSQHFKIILSFLNQNILCGGNKEYLSYLELNLKRTLIFHLKGTRVVPKICHGHAP